MSEHTRIKFYSVHDLSFASNMKRVESFFEKWEQNTCSPDINTILELYNIKQYFSTGRVLSTWSNEQLDEYQKKVSLIPGIIGRFCNSVLDEEWNNIPALSAGLGTSFLPVALVGVYHIPDAFCPCYFDDGIPAYTACHR